MLLLFWCRLFIHKKYPGGAEEARRGTTEFMIVFCYYTTIKNFNRKIRDST